MKNRYLNTIAFGITLWLAGSLPGQTSDRADGMRFIPDVGGQFRALTERPEALGFHIDGTVDPSFCKHYQGLVRVEAADGTPYFLLTRSGNTPSTFGAGIVCDDSDGERGWGNLVVVKLGSRDRNGERLRSNRLRKGVHVDSTAPPSEDAATGFFTVTANGLVAGYGGSPRPQQIYQHPGGMQAIGHVVAMAMDTPANTADETDPDKYPTSMVMFFDVSDPENPVLKSKYAPVNNFDDHLHDADGIAITPLPGGYYLMVIISGFPSDEGDHGTFYFYRSTIANSDADPNVLMNPQLSWELVREVGPPRTEDAHQSLHFFREGSIDGELYLAGSRGHPVYSDHDRIDLYHVVSTTRDFDPRNPSGQLIGLIPDVNSRRITPFPNTGGAPTADLAAAAGFYESPSGELLFYATQHENEGPRGTGDSPTVNAGEWRHINVVRDNSPTYLPTAAINGPFVVDEGSNVTLSGAARPPITKAWIELFSARDYGGPHFSTIYPIVDYDDFDKDDYDDFSVLEHQHFTISDDFYLSDKAQSWKWFAPPGCSIYVMDHANGVLDETRTLLGNGLLHSNHDLREVLNDGGTDDIDQEIDAVDFLADCDQYYATPPVLRWDLDLNGIYETTGTVVSFSAAAIDGPAEVDVPVQAQHPFGGAAGAATARVTVRNVAPQLAPLRMVDSAGNELGGVVPFALTNLPVSVRASFTDPGVLDHQSAAIAWGDGAVQPQSAFTSFNDAFGGRTGDLSHIHRYTAPGAYQFALTVTDDDNGASTQQVLLEVLTPAQANDQIVQLLDELLAITSNARARADLQRARKSLVGSTPQSNDGARNKIATGNNQAAIAFLRQAIDNLRRAEAGGANAATLIALINQVMAALSA